MIKKITTWDQGLSEKIIYDFVWLKRVLRHVSEKLTIKVNVNFLHFIPTQTCFEKKTCVNRKHNSTIYILKIRFFLKSVIL